MPSTFEQFIRFGTDAAGLERTLRLIQASIQLTLFYPKLFTLLTQLLTLIAILTGSSSSHHHHAQPAPDAATLRVILTSLRARVAIGRRFFRLFRFLESFHSAWRLFAFPSPAPSTERYLDALGRTFNGFYLLLETALLLDAMAVEGLQVWEKGRGAAMAREAQRFWFLALVCAVGAGFIRLVRLWPVALDGRPKTGTRLVTQGEGNGLQEKRGASRQTTMEEVVQRQREAAVRLRAVRRRLIADVLDLAVPGSVIGWVKADAGTVGLAMLGSTYFTAMEIWDRCGRQLQAAST